MKALKMADGNLEFSIIEGTEEFEQRIVNSLQVFSVETYWDITKGISYDVISAKDINYKLEHIKSKLLEWYGEELSDLRYSSIKQKDNIVEAVLEYTHKEYGSKEVGISV